MLSAELRALSLSIHAHPETSYEEHHAHTVLTSYLESKGFAVVRGAVGISTAFVVSATVAGLEGSQEKQDGGVTLGFVSEYDALPGIGHAVSSFAWVLSSPR
jgi:metal-dependent amidase/aminoacylase/carboxypeptidase family protein